MLAEFFKPYFSILEGAAWSIEQSLSGLGLISLGFFGPIPGNAPAPTASEAMIVVALGLFTYSVLLSIPLLLTGYVLGRKTGLLLVATFLVLPGVMSLFELWPSFSTAPKRFIIGGTGALGSPWGTGPLLFLGLVSGWALTLLAADIFKLRDRFWYAYDHVWYVAALVAGIFFVADADVKQHQHDLEENTEKIRQTSSYLRRQVEFYDDWCQKNGRMALSSCQWASLVQYKLTDYEYSPDYSFSSSFAPKSTAQIYGGGYKVASDDEIRKIRTEISAYNRLMCPVKYLGNGFSRPAPPSILCRPTPHEVAGALTEPLDGETTRETSGTTMALASELLVPNLVRLEILHKKLAAEDRQNKHDKHFRWLYYILFSLVVGGKVANATAKLIDMPKREDKETRRSLYLIRRIALCLWQAVSTTLITLWRFLVWTTRQTISLFLRARSFGNPPGNSESS